MRKLFFGLLLLTLSLSFALPDAREVRAMVTSTVESNVRATVHELVNNQSQLRDRVSEAVKSMNQTMLRVNQTLISVNSSEIVVNASPIGELTISRNHLRINGLDINESEVKSRVTAMINSSNGVKSINIVREMNVVKLVDNLSHVPVRLSVNNQLILNGSDLVINASGVQRRVSLMPSDVIKRFNNTVRDVELTVEGERAVYKVQEEKQVRILGLIPVNLSIKSSVDAGSGEVVSVSKPWWSFLTI